MQPEQLWATTLDPARRRLRRLTVGDAAQAAATFALLMGSKVRRSLQGAHVARMQDGDRTSFCYFKVQMADYWPSEALVDNQLMADSQVAPRRELIEANGARFRLDDLDI
jgi:DNA gyrase/topoisomerase IV subunit B